MWCSIAILMEALCVRQMGDHRSLDQSQASFNSHPGMFSQASFAKTIRSTHHRIFRKYRGNDRTKIPCRDWMEGANDIRDTRKAVADLPLDVAQILVHEVS